MNTNNNLGDLKSRFRFLRKSYAMHRMAKAIERAIEAQTSKEKERAARWAAAWGLLCGIKTAGVRLRRSEVEHELICSNVCGSDEMARPSALASTETARLAEMELLLQLSDQPPLLQPEAGPACAVTASGTVDTSNLA